MRKILYRYLLYALAVTVATAAILLLALRFPGNLYFEHVVPGVGAVTSEFSPVEILQNILLIFCAGTFAWIAGRDRLRRPMAAAFAGLFLACLIRELDFFLDFYVVDNLWQVLCAVLLSFGFVYIFRERVRFAQGWRRSWPSAGLAMIIGGLILLIPFAQLIGHQGLWQEIMGDSYVRLIKVAVEEFIELGGYAMLSIGTAEFLYAWSRLPRTRTFDARPRRPRG